MRRPSARGSLLLLCLLVNVGDAQYVPAIGNFTWPISTTSPEAQHWFDQGVVQEFGFNQAEARIAFAKAVVADPGCAMCAWGQSYAEGPFLNKPFCSEEELADAYKFASQASAFAQTGDATPFEKALIAATTLRFSGVTVNQTLGDLAYANALSDLVSAMPDEGYAHTLYAEALMDLVAHNYYKPDKSPRPETVIATRELELTIARWAEAQPLALHLYIHLTEETATAARAEKASDELAEFSASVGSGHLNHMPGHNYLRVGRYNDAMQANIMANVVDEDYIKNEMVTYGPGHNTVFLVYAANMDGQSKVAHQYSAVLRDIYRSDPNRDDSPATDLGWNYALTTLVRFGQWDSVLADTEIVPEDPNHEPPIGPFPYAHLLRHYARGLALAATGDSKGAFVEWTGLQQVLPTVSADLMPVAKVANLTLTARLAATLEETVAILQTAVDEQVSWAYTEPPAFDRPLRQCLGRVLLSAERWAEAEDVYRADLMKFQDNGWSLLGLLQAMKAQPAKYNPDDIAKVQQQLDQAWARADVAPSSSCLAFD